MKNIYIFTFFIILFSCCEGNKLDKELDDLVNKELGFGGNNKICGNIKTIDIRTTDTISVENIDVFLSNKTFKKDQYYVSVKTDGNGYFCIENLVEGSYIIFTQKVDTINKVAVHFYDSTSVTTGANELVTLYLKMDPEFGNLTINGIVLYYDFITGKTRAITNANVKIKKGSLPGFVADLKTDEEGQYIVPALKAGDYSINYSWIDPVSLIKYSGSRSLSLNEDKFLTDTIQTNEENAVLLYVIDEAGVPLAHFPYAFYTNKKILEKDSLLTSGFPGGKTNQFGYSVIKNLNPSTEYYIVAKDSLASLELQGIDSVVVGNDFKRVEVKAKIQ